MYDLSLVKKKKRNRRVAIASSVGAVGVTALIIVAFLGRSVGTFTVSLENDGVSLSMDTHSSFDHETTYLNVSGFGNITGQFSYGMFNKTESCSFERINNEDTTYEIGTDANEKGLRFFKYTFFVKNNGAVDATYDLDVNIVENKMPSNNSNSLDEYLRLMVFEEGSENKIYAKRSLTRIDGPDHSYKEYVADGPDDDLIIDDFYGEANLFVDENKIARITNNLNCGEIRMYTILFWLEGSDPEGSGNPPKNASLRLGAKIYARPQSK